MKFLIVGDIVGRSGLDRLKEELEKRRSDVNFIIVNGENSASGKGLRTKEYEEIMSYGADVITMGNHMYYRKEMASEYKNLPRLLIPANLTNLEGNKSIVVEKNGVKVGVVNLLGAFGMGDMIEKNLDNPFVVIDPIIESLKGQGADYIFVDFHAEATAEKIAMGYNLENRVSCVFGTHTHVQTADEKILPNGTGYITDIGMTGPKFSVIGMDIKASIKRFETTLPEKYKIAEGKCIFNGVIFDVDDNTLKVKNIKRIYIG